MHSGLRPVILGLGSLDHDKYHFGRCRLSCPDNGEHTLSNFYQPYPGSEVEAGIGRLVRQSMGAHHALSLSFLVESLILDL